MEQYLWIMWLGIFVVTVIIEASTAELVSIFFGFGALVAMIISFIPGVDWWIELVIFVVISGVTLFALRPLVKRVLNKQARTTNIDSFIGKKHVVSGVNELGYKEVKINGITWTVENVDEEESLEVGDKVQVVNVRGNTLIVRKEEK